MRRLVIRARSLRSRQTLVLVGVVMIALIWVARWAYSVPGHIEGWTASPASATSPTYTCARPADASGTPAKLLTEHRGNVALTLWQGPTARELTICLATRGSDRGATPDYVALGTTVKPGPFATSASPLPFRDGQVRLIGGRAPKGTTKVTLRTRANGMVVASMSGEWFAAWWPIRRYEEWGLADSNPTIDVVSADGTSASMPLREFGR